ncbi:MAG: CDP-diacylglycerol--serine O-phosphatidyltransferase [Desulfotomaculaceae bacterium]|nr:CDP-diacylglycerol--serine O-phosphatidyltransferase [Desulfotomaculaceae bacterium]
MPNICTAINLLLGVVALANMFDGNYNVSIVLILIAALIDRFDGIVARRYHAASTFGKEFDSLADLISFGVAPGALMYCSVGGMWGIVALFLFGLFALCGGLRLARYNLSENPSYFQGVPITLAGSILVIIIYFQPGSALILVSSFLLALAMISNIRIPKI